jgi:hypothetical protein
MQRPVTADGRIIYDYPQVTASDDTSVGMIPYKPQVSISNAVVLGSDNSDGKCKNSVEKVSVSISHFPSNKHFDEKNLTILGPALLRPTTVQKLFIA